MCINVTKVSTLRALLSLSLSSSVTYKFSYIISIICVKCGKKAKVNSDAD